MKICVLGAGAWGFCLATVLAENGHQVILWAKDGELIDSLAKGEKHPKLKAYAAHPSIRFAKQLEEGVQGVDLIVESVTSQGVRPVLQTLRKNKVPLVITSKGIEEGTGLLLTEVAKEVLGSTQIGCLSGPSLAEEVMRKLPTSIVCSSYENEIMELIKTAFSSPYFRVYPNNDMVGVSFGGAMKNIIAIACGISDGLGFGQNTKAALMTRGLHEIRKLGLKLGCRQETLNGLAGLGDLCVTCLSSLSRNYLFGRHLAQGENAEEAKEKIGMVVEGAFTCVAALELAEKHGVALPISEAVYSVIYKGDNPKNAVTALLQRVVKEEHL